MRFIDKAMIIIFSLLTISLITGVVVINRALYIATALLTSFMMGVVSPLVAARRLYFLAVEASHIALFAAASAIILVNITIVKFEMFWVVVVGLAFIYIAGYIIHKGVDPDIATSIITAGTISGSVMVMYFALTRFRTSYSLWSLILGDPLLVTHRDILILSLLTLTIVTISLVIYKVIIYIGIDRDSSILVFGRKVHLYEFLFFTVIGLTSLAVVKIIGYVLEHVLLLLPALVAMNIAEGGKKIMFSSVCIAITSNLLGFSLAVKFNLAPASSTGFITLAIYLVSIATSRLKKYG